MTDVLGVVFCNVRGHALFDGHTESVSQTLQAEGLRLLAWGNAVESILEVSTRTTVISVGIAHLYDLTLTFLCMGNLVDATTPALCARSCAQRVPATRCH